MKIKLHGSQGIGLLFLSIFQFRVKT